VTTTRFSLAPLKPKVANPSKNPSSNLPRIASKTRVSLWYNVTQRFSGTSRFTIPAKISNTYYFKTASASRASTTNLIRFAELYFLKNSRSASRTFSPRASGVVFSASKFPSSKWDQGWLGFDIDFSTCQTLLPSSETLYYCSPDYFGLK
jgi:hypothetical protein